MSAEIKIESNDAGKDRPFLVITGSPQKPPFRIGVGRARLILKHIEDIKEFFKKYAY